MKKFAFFLCLCFSLNCVAQKVTVSKKSEKVKGGNKEGFATELDGKKEEVAVAWGKYVKELGKIKSGDAYQYVESPVLGGTVYTTGIVYLTSRGNEEKGTVWAGIDAAEWTVNDIKITEGQLEKFVYQFGIKFYRDKIQAQIDEAQRALDAVIRQQQRLVTENKNLNNKLVNNGQEKLRLEKALEANKLENLVLLQKIENNKKAQDSVSNTTVPIKKAIDFHTERLRKVN
ncbi:MAG: hypothetical protein K2U26_02835 [Cyclobacteriaceae bacterium]|nr:hypothetical protein [Cyclobacteriaceae bacterium]